MSLWDDSLDLSIKSRDAIQEFAYYNSDLVYATGAIAVVFGALWWIAFHLTKVPGEEKKMNRGEYILSRREKRQQDQNTIADYLSGGLLNAYTDGKIDEDTYKRVHIRLGTAFGFKDMLPQKLTPEQLKEAMKKRRGHKSYRVVPFPKETPASPTTLKGILSKFKS